MAVFCCFLSRADWGCLARTRRRARRLRLERVRGSRFELIRWVSGAIQANAPRSRHDAQRGTKHVSRKEETPSNATLRLSERGDPPRLPHARQINKGQG